MDDLKCPHCGKKIHLTDAIKHQIEDSVRESLGRQFEEDKEKELAKAKEILEKELEEKNKGELTDLRRQIDEKEKKVEEMREYELKLREEKRKIEEREKEIELEMTRKLDEERKKIEDTVLRQAVEQHRLKDKEKDKVIDDLKKALDDARRKASQGSQQLQGEVLELDIENLLRDTFTQDEIEPVEKGVKGADIRQIVRSPKGYTAGVILWEIKQTKTWDASWTSKLKEDLRKERSNVPVIVTSTLPKRLNADFGLYDGVWVTTFSLVIPLAILLRKNLLDIAYQKAVSVRKGDKSEDLYDYITSHEFRQQVEAMVEVYSDMKIQLDKERVAYEKLWKVREAQIEKVLGSTANVVGSIQGRVGPTALPIKGLELLDDGN